MKCARTMVIGLSLLIILASRVSAQEQLTVLYPSPAGSWMIPVIAKEARYFEKEGLAVEYVRVGGSTRIVAALLGGSAQIIHAGEPAVVPAVQRGADVVIIAAFCNAAQHRLIVRPEIKDIKDLKGKPVGITTFGSTSDYILRFALQRAGLDPNKDVSIVQTGGQPEGLAAMTAGKIFAQRMGFPFHIKAQQLGMRELIDFSKLGLEENIGAMITTRAFIAQRRSTVLRYMRAFVRGMHRFKTDKEFAKKTYGRFAQINDDALLEANWQEYAGHMLRSPRPTLKGVQQVIESGTLGKIDVKPERLVDFSLVDELEKTGFIDAVYK
ncbi:MAG: ABC transporter substrate-binding protein, partial [Candidatus Binatia bacterium]